MTNRCRLKSYHEQRPMNRGLAIQNSHPQNQAQGSLNAPYIQPQRRQSIAALPQWGQVVGPPYGISNQRQGTQPNKDQGHSNGMEE
ncbi:hypothetical protein NDU88_004511 [Pleurodeles waltl]|uniref:Uncharacterized protein n=1 Tax=Pleurodeles waltl TaxID=8319 RepID=A0AAV7SJ23_PLEWA|nr:hypothetical protein NDU88_004511 [Pleurodeles waltl]